MIKKSIMYEPVDADDLSNFFQTNKENYLEIWIVITKKEHANPQPVTFKEAVTKAIDHGLVDSRTKSLDEKKYAIRFTKRKGKKDKLV
jgi:hypothetical protein